MIKLTEENYYSKEANMDYASCSLLKNFMSCEHRALAELKGDFIRQTSDSMLLGSYVDTMLLEPEKVNEFMETHPMMFSSKGATKGELKSTFKRGITMVERAKKDEMFMSSLVGDHQRIFTGELFGVPFKCKLDVYREGKYITDLKTCADFNKRTFDENEGKYVNWIQAFNYQLQGAIYTEIVRQNTGELLPFYISGVTSQEHPRLGIFQIDRESMDEALANAEPFIRRIPLLKSGELEPIPCGECDYCADTLPVTEIHDWLSREDESDAE